MPELSGDLFSCGRRSKDCSRGVRNSSDGHEKKDGLCEEEIANILEAATRTNTTYILEQFEVDEVEDFKERGIEVIGRYKLIIPDFMLVVLYDNNLGWIRMDGDLRYLQQLGANCYGQLKLSKMIALHAGPWIEVREGG